MTWREQLGLRPRERRDAPYPPLPTNGSIGIRYGNTVVTNETILRNSAVWACLDLRAKLMASFPLDVYRYRGDRMVEMAKPPVLITPHGPSDADPGVSLRAWQYATQYDKDRAGNAFGLVTEHSKLKSPRWPHGIPARIELCQLGDVQVRRAGGKLQYVIGGKTYEWWQVWHERSHLIAGMDVGLSAVAFAAMAAGNYLSAQQFALDWFGGGGMPSVHLKNTKKSLTPLEAAETKRRYQAAAVAGGAFVSGDDWELSMMGAVTAQSEFLNAMAYSVPELCRFFGVPADLVDGAIAGASITYANITERNLQFLVMHLGPAVGEKEDDLGTLTPAPRFVKLNSDALLRMDPLKRAQLDQIKINSRTLAPSEVRALDNRDEFTPEQLAEIDHFWPPKAAVTAGSSTPSTAQEAAA